MKKIFLFASLIALAALVAFAAPADGTWTLTGSVSGAPQTLVLQVSGATVSGTADGVQITNGKVMQTSITFQVIQNSTPVTYKGLVLGTKMNLFQELHGLRLVYNHQ